MSDDRELMVSSVLILWAVVLAGLFLAMIFHGCIEPQRAPILMRPFEKADLQAIEAGEMPCCFDIAIDHGQQQYPLARQRLIDAGKGIVTYFNMHDVQPQVTRGEWRTPWFSFLADTVMAAWGAYLVNSAGDTAFYAFYGGNRYLMNWARIDSARAEVLAQAQLRAAGVHSAAFWDVYFPRLDWWMFSGSGAQFSTFAYDTVDAYEENLRAALRIARRAFEKNHQRVPFSVMVNGDWSADPPVCLEGMEQSPQGTFRQAVKLWAEHEANSASVKAHHTAWVDSVIARWTIVGGLLAFTDVTAGDEDYKRAYARADSVRRGEPVSVFVGETNTEGGPH